jgi:8-oxo-dGTP pyrophosphatase MutT (NUDIX family)
VEKSSKRPRVRKVLVYVTRDHQLLVFRHIQQPEAGLQVPAGTIEVGEEPAAAAIRELAEESGLSGERAELLGSFEFDMLPYRDEIQERFVFHVVVPQTTPESWTHYETHSGSNEPIEFEFYWRDMDGTDLDLAGGQGRLLQKLFERIPGIR